MSLRMDAPDAQAQSGGPRHGHAEAVEALRCAALSVLTRRQLLHLLDKMDESVFVVDVHERLVHVNAACARRWGATPEVLLGTSVSQLFSDEQRRAFLQDMDALAQGQVVHVERLSWSAEHQAHRRIGVTKIPVMDDAGGLSMLVCLMRDISHEHDTRQALKASEARYQTMVSQLQVGVLVQGPDDRILLCNPRALELLGMTEDQLQGRGSMDPQWHVLREDGSRFAPHEHPSMVAARTLQPVRDVIMGVYHPQAGRRVWLQVQADPVCLADGGLSHVIVSFADVTELRLARQLAQARESEVAHQAAHIQAVLDGMVEGVVTIDAQGLMASANQAACFMFGYAAEELIGHNVSMLMPEPHRSHHDGYLRHSGSTGEARVVGTPREVHGQRKDGSLFPMSLSVNRVMRDGQAVYVGVVRDISSQRLAEEEIHRLAYYDAVTGLPNRRLLMDRLQHAVRTAGRSGRRGAVLFLDLDHFKLLNDTGGHDEGDALLRQVAHRLTHAVRDSDTVARLGGDEFIVLLENLGADEQAAAHVAEAVAHKVRESLDQPYRLPRHAGYRITPSIGIVVFQGERDDVHELLKKADVAMYQAKSAGRDAVRFYDPDMQAAAVARARLDREMREGLGRGEFHLLYQPQVDAQGRLIGVEALVRWRHPQRGLVSPADFIPLAEETGFIVPLGAWIMEAACLQLAAWALHPRTAQWTMAVNVSALQAHEADFVDQVLRTLQATQAVPQRLKLELTESLLSKDIEQMTAKMRALKAHGVGFSLDDFGTGYSSLAYLQQLPIDQLKIDQRFVRDLACNAGDAAIARTVIALGHSLGLSVLAEGVETEVQHTLLQASGCDAFQGYLFGRPMTAECVQGLLPMAA